MSEFRVVEANGDPYPPHAQPCRTLAAALRRRDYVREIWETYERDLEGMRAFDEVWRGLPAFEARTPPPQLRVECATPEERDSLVKLIGVRVSKKNREAHSAWWPPRPKQDLASLQFVYAGAGELREAS